MLIHIPKKFALEVKKGDRVERGQVIAVARPEKKPEISLYSLLEVKPDKIKKFLTKNEGSYLKKGEIIAQRKTLFLSIRVKSPVTGVLKILKEKPGYIQIETTKEDKIKAYATGVVSKVEEGGLIIETEGIVFKGISGSGEAEGELAVIKGNTIFNINKEVAGKIVLCLISELNPACFAKIKTLGGLGLIMKKDFGKLNIPSILIEEADQIKEYAGKNVTIINDEFNHFLIINS